MADKPELVLVIDDNAQNREVAEGHLLTAGYGAVLADSGESGLARFEEHHPHLVLLDVVMPRMDGFETCRRLRALPGGADTPIVFLTALGDLATHRAAIDVGADDFLTKPINRTELLIRLRSLLRIRRLSEELRQNYDLIRTQRDALLAAHRQKIELATLLVHDLKNPLSSILSNVDYVTKSEDLPERDRESLNDVLRASRSMFRMVMNLLDISRSEDGALVPHCVEFDLEALLREIASEAERRLEERGQTLHVQVDPALGAITADRDLVRRVIENLLDNSHKYSPRGGQIHVAVTAAVMSSTDGRGAGAAAANDGAPAVELRVRDQGAGIPPAYRSRVFEKYVRIDDDGSPTGEQPQPRNSQGLGLVFCRTAVEVHGGQIWVEENPPRGSCFCVRLRRVARVDVAAAAAHEEPSGGSRLVAVASAG